MEDGLVHVYTGKGKGKTTAAVGLALRAAGWDLKTLIIQFMKGKRDGVANSLRDFERINLTSYGREEFLQKEEITDKDKELAQEGLNRFKTALKDDKIDIIILDEICVALDYGLIPVDPLLSQLKTADKEIIMTGRGAPQKLIEMADYVSEIKSVKHPYQQGVKARKGIEY